MRVTLVGWGSWRRKSRMGSGASGTEEVPGSLLLLSRGAEELEQTRAATLSTVRPAAFRAALSTGDTGWAQARTPS